MEFRQGGHRDERRRRVLIDDTGTAEPSANARTARRHSEPDSPSARPAQRYTDAALSPHQPRVTDLIPARRWSNLVLLTLLLSCAAGIEALYGYLALGYTPFDVALFPAINLGARGNVATWFSSALLATCAVFGLLTYQIRRYRTDDYRGRYRMWCWVVPLFILASIDQVAGIQESVRAALLHVGNIPNYADAQLVWVASIALVTAAVGGRLIIEMRGCRMASLMLVVSLAGLAALSAAQVGLFLVDVSVFRSMALAALTMGAHIALLMAIFLYARYVYRDALGQVPARRVRKRRVKPRRSESAVDDDAQDAAANTPQRAKVSRRGGGEVIRTDPPHTPRGKSSTDSTSAGDGDRSEAAGASKTRSHSTRKEKRRVAATTTTTTTRSATGKSATSKPVASKPVASKPVASRAAAGSMCEPDDDQVEPTRKLSKAERKRLRKQRRKDRQD